MFQKILENVKEKTPIVHCITNYVTVNDCANVLLACGGSPIMADDSEEVEEITSICNGLDLNIGTLNQRTIESMKKAGKKANELDHVVLLDPVGAGASTLRTKTALMLMKELKLTVLRGNISEIKTLYYGSGSTKGVDADIADAVTKENLYQMAELAKKMSKETGAILCITGPIDIIASDTKAYAVYNGHKMMGKVSGTGCMLSAMIPAFCAANPDSRLEAVLAAVCCMGYSGEVAYEKMIKNQVGVSSFRTYIIDAISMMDGEQLEEGAKFEEIR